MALTSAERKARERKRMRSLGYTKKETWIHESELSAWTRFVSKLKARRAKNEANGNED